MPIKWEKIVLKVLVKNWTLPKNSAFYVHVKKGELWELKCEIGKDRTFANRKRKVLVFNTLGVKKDTKTEKSNKNGKATKRTKERAK